MKKKGKSKFSVINAWIHLWPSIVAGIILVFVCITGTIVVYENELCELTAGKKALYIEPNGDRLSVDDITKIYKEKFPEDFCLYIVFYKNPKRSLRLLGFSPKEKNIYYVYMNPNTGIISDRDYTIDFIHTVAHLHSELLLGNVGGWIVGISTIVFVLSTITGLVLWWPKKWNKRNIDMSFKVKWKAKFKRLNYDLHNVFGFYSSILCLLLGITGLILFFGPLMDLTVSAFGGENKDWAELTKDYQLDVDKTKELSFYDTNKMIDRAFEMYPYKKTIRCSLYEYDKLSIILFSLSSSIGVISEEGMENLCFDKFTGEVVYLDTKQTKANKVSNMVMQIHMGHWWGQFGKFSTFISGIVATSLPITGFLVWWGRRKKKKR